MSEAITEGVRILVHSRYHPEHSQPASRRWFFSYTVQIRNESGTPVRLLRRHWKIHHGTGRVEEVRGDGVVGEQPNLSPNEHFEYTSFAQLDASLGAMEGSYTFAREDGTEFLARIAPFTLEDPESVN